MTRNDEFFKLSVLDKPSYWGCLDAESCYATSDFRCRVVESQLRRLRPTTSFVFIHPPQVKKLIMDYVALPKIEASYLKCQLPH